MKLYYAPGACSMAPHIVLHEAGIDATIEKVDLRAKKTESGADFLKINPKGYVPALQLDDGSVLTEAAVIMQYLADRAPGAKLAPPNGTMERYRLQEMLNFITSELHKAFSPLFDPSLPEPARKPILDRIGKRLDLVEKQLEGKQYLFGDAFTIADAYLATIVNWSGHVTLDLSKWPNIKAYRKRVLDRPGAKAVLKAEGLSK
jgi:glutathione S-transferase